MLPKVTARPFRDEADFWRVRDLLIETYSITPPAFNWEVRRWDGMRFHREEREQFARWEEHLRLWETADGHLVGAAHPEGEGAVHLQVHPNYRHLEDEMIAWAEERLARTTEEGKARQLVVDVYEHDVARRRLLEQRGYEKTPDGGMAYRLRLSNQALPEPRLATGYVMRTTHSDADCQRIADLLNASFGRTGHTAAEYRHFVTKSPSFRHDLNLVAEASGGNGSLACHVGVTYVEANHYGVFEPVCTHPDHQRHGLARALMFEGMRRLEALGATEAYVGTGDGDAANRLYEAVGFTEAYKDYLWRKVF